jgi:hypothetical protein
MEARRTPVLFLALAACLVVTAAVGGSRAAASESGSRITAGPADSHPATPTNPTPDKQLPVDGRQPETAASSESTPADGEPIDRAATATVPPSPVDETTVRAAATSTVPPVSTTVGEPAGPPVDAPDDDPDGDADGDPDDNLEGDPDGAGMGVDLTADADDADGDGLAGLETPKADLDAGWSALQAAAGPSSFAPDTSATPTSAAPTVAAAGASAASTPTTQQATNALPTTALLTTLPPTTTRQTTAVAPTTPTSTSTTQPATTAQPTTSTPSAQQATTARPTTTRRATTVRPTTSRVATTSRSSATRATATTTPTKPTTTLATTTTTTTSPPTTRGSTAAQPTSTRPASTTRPSSGGHGSDPTGSASGAGSLDAIRNRNSLFDRYADVPADRLSLDTPGLLVDADRPDNGSVGDGQFRAACEYSHFGYDDPIIYPGQPGASHLHMFFGNTETNAHSTTESLLNSGGGSCNGFELNRSGYWTPALLDGRGNVVVPDRIILYYKSKYPDRVEPMPQGLKMVVGNTTAESFTANPNLYWSCGSSGSINRVSNRIQACGEGQSLNATIAFPECWDGRLDSPDHRSHMKLIDPVSECPDSHPRRLPQIAILLYFPGADSVDGWHLSSDRMGSFNATPGGTLHADWWGAWNDDAMNLWTDGCMRAARNCSFGQTGSSRRLAPLNGWETYRGENLLPLPAG